MDETPEIPETPSSFSENDLSTEDLAILRKFDAMEDFLPDETSHSAGANLSTNTSSYYLSPGQGISPAERADGGYEEVSPEDLLLLFISEVEEDVGVLRNGVQQLAPGETLDVLHLQLLERKAHKIKGTAGAFGSNALASIARYTETLIHLLVQGSLRPRTGLAVLMSAISALEATLNSLVTIGEESPVPLAELEAEFKARNMDVTSGSLTSISADTFVDFEEPGDVSPSVPVDMAMTHIDQLLQQGEQLTDLPSVRIDLDRFEQLLLHSEQLTDRQMSLRSAQQQVEIALQELHSAQARLMRLEFLYSTVPLFTKVSDSTFERQVHADDRPASSMIAGILDEANERLGRDYEHKGRRQTRHFYTRQPLYWDELEIDSYTETDTLKNKLSEAIADVATAATQVRTAFAQLNNLLQKQMAAVQSVRRDTLSLRLTPLRALMGRIERVVTMNDRAKPGHIHFEMQGETVEIDQHILEELKTPLLHLARTCVTPSLQHHTGDEMRPYSGRVWFYATAVGNEVAIEIGTSLLVEGGALDEVQDTIRRLHGSIFVQRNAVGGISFHLRLPRSQGSIWGLLVQAGQQRVMVPFAQIQRIEYGPEGEKDSHPLRGRGNNRSLPVYSLSNLLGVPPSLMPAQHIQPILLLHPESSRLRIQVDAVIGEVEQVVRPLAPYLRSPGIIGSVVDNTGYSKDVGNASDVGEVLLVVNLVELIGFAAGRKDVMHRGEVREELGHYELRPYSSWLQKVVLVADDSISIRKSLLQTLSAAGYRAVCVNDGMEALEYLLDHDMPHVLLLDVEMPNLNGYDLLSIIRAHPQLATAKIVMLTSRSSEKHKRRALEMGAHAYLTKPCPQDVLLNTIRSLPQ